MNKTISKVIVALICLTSLQLNSQTEGKGAIVGTPDKYQGYFIFDSKKFPEVTNWVTTISELKWNQEKEVIDTIPQELIRNNNSKTKQPSNFTKIDTRYLAPEIGVLCTVTGYDVNGNIVTTDKWDRIPFTNERWSELCGATCLGKSYVYRITINQLEELNSQGVWEPGSGHKISLTGDTQFSMPEYGFDLTHTRYMSPTQETQFCGSYPSTNSPLNVNSPAHHALWQGCPDNYLEPTWRRFTNVGNESHLNDINMTRLTGTVYGVQKARGIWNHDDGATTDVLTGQAQSVCGQYINSTIGLTNYANNVLTLENNLFCNGYYSAGSSTTYGHGNKPGKFIWNYVRKDKNTNGGTGTPKPSFDVFKHLEKISGGHDIEGYDNTTGIPWWPSDSVLMMNFFKLDVSNPAEDNSIAKMSFRKDSLFSPNGSPVSTNFTLEKGLYEINYLLNDGLNFPLIFEVLEKTTQSYALSNYLSINIFPVPINKDGSYSVNFDAKATLKFDYIVYDEFGKKQFERKFVMHQGHERTVKIRDNKLPSGILFHKFVFEDNSEINITTLKE